MSHHSTHRPRQREYVEFAAGGSAAVSADTGIARLGGELDVFALPRPMR